MLHDMRHTYIYIYIYIHMCGLSKRFWHFVALPLTACMYVVPRGELPWKRRKLQQASVADPEQRRQLHNTKVHSESSSSKAASASDVTSSAANAFRLACAEPSELHQAVGICFLPETAVRQDRPRHKRSFYWKTWLAENFRWVRSWIRLRQQGLKRQWLKQLRPPTPPIFA